jgi:hypothetical protein
MRRLVVTGRAANLPEDEHGQYASKFSWKSFRREHGRAAVPVETTLEAWRTLHQIAKADLWIMDAALQTVAFAAVAHKPEPVQWFYSPPERLWPKFTPKLRGSTWRRSDHQPWPKFAKKMRSQFGKELDEYRRVMTSMAFPDDLGKKDEDRDARWLARYVGGESWDSIAAEVAAQPGASFAEPKSSVVNNSRRFAKRIGLTPPHRKPGRRPRP